MGFGGWIHLIDVTKMVSILALASDMRSNPQPSFYTHANYITAFHTILDRRPKGVVQSLADSVHDRVVFSGILPTQKRSPIDLPQLRLSLSNAWGTEHILYVLKEASDDDETSRLANNWACIKIYYIFYHSVQALRVAQGHSRMDSHDKTQNSFFNCWCNRGKELGPWTLSYHPNEAINAPNTIRIDLRINQFEQCTEEKCWSLALKALRTTREDEFKSGLLRARLKKQKNEKDAWKKPEEERLGQGKRPRRSPSLALPLLTDSEKACVNASLRPYTLMDYLYRLRIKSNYVDSDMFTEGPQNTKVSRAFLEQICDLASMTIFVTELCVSRYWGRSDFLSFRESWFKARVTKQFQGEEYNRQSLLKLH
jgi:hypothetical protein